MLCVFNGIVLGKKPAKAAATDDHFCVSAGKVLPDRVDIVYDLFEGVRLGGRALPVAAIVE